MAVRCFIVHTLGLIFMFPRDKHTSLIEYLINHSWWMFYGTGPHVNILCVHNRKAHKLTMMFLEKALGSFYLCAWRKHASLLHYPINCSWENAYSQDRCVCRKVMWGVCKHFQSKVKRSLDNSSWSCFRNETIFCNFHFFHSVAKRLVFEQLLFYLSTFRNTACCIIPLITVLNYINYGQGWDVSRSRHL